MILKAKKNKGFTLVELIVAIAVLALLITAVVTFMGHESVTLKKQEADISVQNSGQETLNELSDIIIQAKELTIEGYVFEDNYVYAFNKKKVGESIAKSATAVKYQRKSLIPGGDSTTLNYEDNGYKHFPASATVSGDYLKTKVGDDPSATVTYKNIYLSKLTVKYSVPYDSNYLGTGITDPGNVNDECTAIITFNQEKIYIEKTYKYMTKLNSSGVSDNTVYTSKLNYGTSSNGKIISAARITVDPLNQSLSLNLDFAYQKHGASIQNIINIKNSNVLIDPKE
ncbi:prepilin-type N-terminal cleavage/methylation domain-containing protein [Eubacterium ruminantium]|uniref:Prepilin-type N-terminal cleavage/methylation domain-containing protein n=1 Tax=Eubacterium ruminantium TaxID=42322 RepID=A0A1T4MIG0_9FIRM|nr:prepilin-type N-terminal cleavage/methylation domain-containing protein [Eubacterium ruminantium]SCW48369.1 prepilin-type N-terminal cleavage/methylation domain-containing protein [Eubacterium ruminantium]SDM57348.1 prepilin-type N-terminal cleavage/methylation domain-containing protein [Eubacterium ruminantium]SJZ66870.1 prepilin-type N-terminal cleavage/methylation domain-containing protein [Eubacterium ruminantium]